MFQPRHISLLAAALILTSLPHFSLAKDVLNKPLNEWVSHLDSPDASTRRKAIFAIGKAGKEAAPFVPRLARALKDDNDATVRDAAAYAMGEIGATDSKEAIPVLKNALINDRDPKVRRSAAYALGSYATANFKDLAELHKQLFDDRAALHKALNDPDAVVRQSAAWALGRIVKKDVRESKATVDALMSHVTKVEPDPLVRRDAANALGDIGRPRASSAAGTLLKSYKTDDDQPARKTALTALVNVVPRGDKQTAKELEAILNKLQRDAKQQADLDREELYGVALALANIGGDEARPAIPVVLKALRDEDKTLRTQAAAGLASIGMPAAETVPELTIALADSEPDVRRNAALALGKMQEKAAPAAPALIKLLDPGEPDQVRLYAVEAIAQAGQEPVEKALPHLRRMIRSQGGDSNWQVRQRSVWALQNLPNIEQAGLIPELAAVLEEKEKEPRLVRYETAVLLGIRLGPRVPDKTIDVLVENINDPTILLYDGPDLQAGGFGPEPPWNPNVPHALASGDARYLPALALGKIGPKANRPDVIESLGKVIAATKNDGTRKAAKDALEKITGKKVK